jgi:hypothetical protein
MYFVGCLRISLNLIRRCCSRSAAELSDVDPSTCSQGSQEVRHTFTDWHTEKLNAQACHAILPNELGDGKVMA